MGVESILSKGKEKEKNNKMKRRPLKRMEQMLLLLLLDMVLQIERGMNNISYIRKVKIGDWIRYPQSTRVGSHCR